MNRIYVVQNERTGQLCKRHGGSLNMTHDEALSLHSALGSAGIATIILPLDF